MDPALLSVIVAAVLTYICGWLLYRVDKAHPAEKTAPPRVQTPLQEHRIRTEQRNSRWMSSPECCYATKLRNRHACFCATCGNNIAPYYRVDLTARAQRTAIAGEK